jgi:hypothetical protein
LGTVDLGLVYPQTAMDSLDPRDATQGAWFGQTINGTNVDPLKVVSEYGVFRENDWRQVRDASAIPEVADYARTLAASGHSHMYLLRADHVTREFELLRTLAILSGHLNGHRWPKVRQLLPQAYSLLRRLLDELPVRGRYVLPTVSLAERPPELEEEAYKLIDAAFKRVFGSSRMDVSATAEQGLACTLVLPDFLSYLYAFLLVNFRRQWKECKRAKCANIFVVEGRREKEYCSWKCAHADSMMRVRHAAKRKAAQKKKRRL